MKSSISMLVLAIGLVGCESKAGTGALVGGGLGVGAGALIGGGSGAVIGGAVGAISGAAVGAILDSADRNNLERRDPNTLQRIDRGEPLTVEDVIAMSQANVDDDKIIDIMEKTHSRYRLTKKQIDRMRNAGVSERVINYMKRT